MKSTSQKVCNSMKHKLEKHTITTLEFLEMKGVVKSMKKNL